MASPNNLLLHLKSERDSLYSVLPTDPVSRVYKHLYENEYDYCPVIDEDGNILGKISVNDLEPLKDKYEIIENVLNREEKWIIFPCDIYVQAVADWSGIKRVSVWAALILNTNGTYDIITYDDIKEWLKKVD
ncbi:MAG: hypothetical protein CL951_08760 [Erythrobacteraceae bacterium]|jgi:predicted transcriptional regulator|nr:hypothetical protein [Erythrobacteraceae bacterium]